MPYVSNEQVAELVGKTPARVWLSKDEETLLLACEEGTMRLPTDADCCSETWWADGIGVKQFLEGSTITAAEFIDMPDYNFDDGRSRQEEDEVYGLRVQTDRGVATFAFRNSSNGYYGGSCYPKWDEGQHALETGYTECTEDWQK